MKNKFLSLIIAFAFIITCGFAFTGCGKKYVDPYPARITNVEADSVTNYWIEYGQTGTHHELMTIAKATKDDTTYYYAIYYNNGNRNEMLVKLDANGHYKAYGWDNNNKTWVARYAEDHPEKAEGDDWFEFKTQFYSDYFSMALVNLQYRGEINSLIRYENGTEIKDMGTTSWTTIGYTCPSLHNEHNIDAEEIENCRHFYDEQNDQDYYFAPETNFLLYYNGSSFSYSCRTKVYKRSFDMNDVLTVHDATTTGLDFTLPSV